MPQSKENAYVLGLDLGVSSVGWALLDSPNQRFVAAGVRIFDSGMDENKFERGEQGASNNVERRTARLHRRQLRRRAARQRDLFLAMQEAGLLPAEAGDGHSETRHRVLTDLDRRLTEAWRGRINQENPAAVAPEQVLPYFLRARALDHRMEPHELGRALYHLGQRRGYKSNRREGRKLGDTEGSSKKKKAPTEKDEKKLVLSAIAGLEEEIAASGARTLGEFLSRQDPSNARIRTRHTARKMFEQEFEKIWSAQEKHHPTTLTSHLKEKLWALLFFQRPIAAGKPGMCELEKGCSRAPMYTLAAQRFRLLQKVNDLAIVLPTGERQFLASEQRKQLMYKLEKEGDLTFPQIRTLLEVPKSTRFNLQLNDEAKVRGNRTNAAMLQAFGEGWDSFSESERKRRVRIWAETEHHDELARTATEEWRLQADAARKLAESEPEDGYSKLSLRALSRLLPLMEAGKPFKTAETEIYGDRFSGNEAKDFLPPVVEVLPQIPNPAVMRALTEMRKVVNAIVREHGKPAQVRVELARDLKRSAKDRQRLMDIAEDNRKRKEKVIKRIEQEGGIPNPSGLYIEKGLLFEELQECAYCGKTINFQNLFSDTPQFDVDHILPISRFPDNAYANKTLACNSCNALKRNRTPFEAFGADTELWERLKARVGRKRRDNRFILGGDKRKRFLLETAEEMADFSARHLADTRYITKLAARYLEELYGGRDREVPWEDQRRRCVFASSGTVTATLRKTWELNKLIPEPAREKKEQERKKSRADHRHHAIDAIVIALSNQAAIQQLSQAAAGGDGRIAGRISSRTLQAPWLNFVDSLRPLVNGMNVSHRPGHKLLGGLHDETNYSPPRRYRDKDVVHVRKAVYTLTPKQIASDDVIVDKAARLAIRAKVAEVGDAKKLENDPAHLVTRRGTRVPVRKVRIRTNTSVHRIAEGMRERHVALRDNHHISIFSGKDRKGRAAWESPGVVSRYEALQRKGAGKPIIDRDLPKESEAQFLFSLMNGDAVEMEDTRTGGRNLYVVRSISEEEIDFVRHNEARRKDDLKKTSDLSGDYVRARSIDRLREWNCRKVLVDALGRLRSAND